MVEVDTGGDVGDNFNAGVVGVDEVNLAVQVFFLGARADTGVRECLLQDDGRFLFSSTCTSGREQGIDITGAIQLLATAWELAVVHLAGGSPGLYGVGADMVRLLDVSSSDKGQIAGLKGLHTNEALQSDCTLGCSDVYSRMVKITQSANASD